MNIKKYEQLNKPPRTYDNNKFKEPFKQFGFSNSQTATFPQGIPPTIMLHENLNQPQLVKYKPYF